MLTCCTLELTIGLCGYLAYDETTVGNVLNNMEVHHWSGLVSRAILATTMFFAYPMNLYIARHACVVLFFEGISAHDGMSFWLKHPMFSLFLPFLRRLPNDLFKVTIILSYREMIVELS